MIKSHKSFTELSQQKNGSLAALLLKLNQFQRYEQILRQLFDTMGVDAQISQQCLVVRQENNSLLLAVDNAACATVLRYHLPQLLQQLRQHHNPALKAIDIVINPAMRASFLDSNEKPRSKSVPTVCELSDNNSQLLNTLTHNTKDSQLKESLQRLCQTLNTKQKLAK